MVIAVIDGMGGGIGAQIVTQLRQELPLDVEIIALGTNAVATQRMMKARADRGASGGNAIRVSINQANFILAPISVVIPNSMMGEITPPIATAVAGARGRRLLLPINQPHLEIEVIREAMEGEAALSSQKIMLPKWHRSTKR